MNNNSMNNGVQQNENIVVSVHMQEIINKLLDQIKDYSFQIAFLAAQNEALRKKLQEKEGATKQPPQSQPPQQSQHQVTQPKHRVIPLSQDENKQKEELKETQKG